jgi:hypothetical protein
MGNGIVAHRIVIGLFYHKIGMACKKHNIELFDNISYIIKFISETSNVAMEDGQYIFIRNIGK